MERGRANERESTMKPYSITIRDYPYWTITGNGDTVDILSKICNIRKDDIATIQNLPNVTVSGRTVTKIPTSSTDVSGNDKIGDINFATDGGNEYMYVLMDIGGAGEWRRVQLNSF